MKAVLRKCRGGALAVFILAGCAGVRLEAADTLVWHRPADTMDGDIRNSDVRHALERVSAATGWEIYLDPGATHQVSATFHDLGSTEALRVMLGDLNFVRLPQTNGATALFVFRTSRGQATQHIVVAASKPAKPIPNQLVVKLKPGSKTKIEDLARALGAKVIGRMDSMDTYLLEFTDDTATQAARAQLADYPDVASISDNYSVDRPPVPVLAQGSSPDLQLNPITNTGGCQLLIGLIDTPVQPLNTNLTPFFKPSISVANNSDCPPSGNPLNHGTAMAETVLQAVKSKTGGSTSVRILPVDVYGNCETTSTFNIAQGMLTAISNGATILNISSGGNSQDPTLQAVTAQAVQAGVTIYAAAGNEPVTTPTYPAAYPGVVGVTASDPSGQIASYANRGSFISMIAPGDNVVNYGGQSYLVEGTSTSTAIASGMAAGLADSAHACADEAQSLLQKSLPTGSLPKQ